MDKSPISQEQLIELLEEYLKLNEDKGVLIAIDGDAASGKSTLGKILARRFDGNLVHSDSFYLPFDQRTDSASGHIDFPRFLSSIMIPFRDKQDLSYYTFNPHINEITDKFSDPYRRILILEGSYCLHPELRPYIDISIALRISPKTQEERIIARSSQEVFERFKAIWIPKEKVYQEETRLFDYVDYIINIE